MPNDPRIELFRRYHAGESPLAIADDLCISGAWALEQLGLEIRTGHIQPVNQPIANANDSKISDMMHDYTPGEISKVTGMTVDSVKKAIRRLKIKKSQRTALYNHPIRQIDGDGKVVHTYQSATEAMRKTGIHRFGIYKCLHGQRKTACGYRWEYEGEANAE